MGSRTAGAIPSDAALAQVRSALGHCIGVANAKHAKELAAAIGMPMRDLRMCITALRLEGIPICATPGTGYFVAETALELEHTLSFLHTRAMHSLRAVRAMRLCNIPELLGQLRLRT